ncbi:NUDIX domain-containing protein [Hymenobacter jejuensis]|uniref:NUDIX domain-containing protein n=1 Tax=Hymenobacter jejuensis TaxID=2502781 RepID=A0A5B8A573_9BACT|nr:NUDIX domain-containing protein [Hymenobacter jejuensis]QDA61352.1 NUDIX domain-containing protein [Hymenobacter jejuensis]
MSEFTPSAIPAESLLSAYTGQVRVRVCGMLVHEGALLLTAHRGMLADEQPFWSPPGGGWQFGETIQDCLKREFLEETGVKVTVGRFLHLHEFKNDTLQALELFFEVKLEDETAIPSLGSDPEHAADAQLLTELAFLTPRQLVGMSVLQLHPVLRHVISPDDVYIPHIQFC